MNADRLFYLETITDTATVISLPEENAKHIIQVLRMKKGEEVYFTDGKGKLAKTTIIDDHKKHPQVQIISIDEIAQPTQHFSIAIALTKNASRFEWFLEKATEMGIAEIIPLKTHRTEKQHFRYDRMNNILISAMLQSQQFWLPKLWEPISFDEFMLNDFSKNEPHKYIAHCVGSEKVAFNSKLNKEQNSGLILIGPEGDFTEEEIETALSQQYLPVSLGDNRLRTETAGMVAASLMMIGR